MRDDPISPTANGSSRRRWQCAEACSELALDLRLTVLMTCPWEAGKHVVRESPSCLQEGKVSLCRYAQEMHNAEQKLASFSHRPSKLDQLYVASINVELQIPARQ